MIHSLTGKREKFCQLAATDETYTAAYLEAFQKPPGYDRKLAAEAADNGLLAPELAAGISRVKSAKTQGIRVGN